MTNVDIGSNLCTNPTLKASTSGWYNSSGSVSKSSIGGRFQVASGAQSAANYRFTAKAGYKYSLTGVKYRKGSGSGSGSLFRLGFYWYNSSGTQISSTVWVAPAATVGVWNSAPRFEATAPAGAVTGRIYVQQSTTTQAMDYYATNFILKRYVLAPTVSAGSDQSKVQGESTTLTATATPGDGAIVSYSWQAGAVSDPQPQSPNTASTAAGPFPSIDVVQYQVGVTDSFGLKAFDFLEVTVGAGPAPQVDAGPFPNVYVGATASLDATVSSVAGIATYAWSEDSTSGVAISTPAAEDTSVGPFTMPGTYTFRLTVTDVNGKAGTDTANVTVLPVPESVAINTRTRLEVLADDVTNLIDNHSAQDGVTTGWTATRGTLSATSGNAFGFDGHALRVIAPIDQYRVTIETSKFAVAAGTPISASLDLYVDDTSSMVYSRAYLNVLFYNVSNVLVGTETIYNDVFAYDDDSLHALASKTLAGESNVTVPATAVTASLQLDLSGLDLNPASVYVSRAQLLVGGAGSSVVGLAFPESGDYWQSLLGTSTSVSLSRGARIDGVTDSLETGLLTAVIPDPTVTPDKNARLRPGKPIRLRAFNTITAEWEPVWTGSISECNVTYRDKRPVVTVSATDAVADLENLQAPAGYSGAFRQRVQAIMDGTPVVYEITDTDADSTSVIITAEDNTTANWQLGLIRNSLHGTIYVDKANTLQAFADNSAPDDTPVFTFSDDPLDVGAIDYTDIDVNFGSKALVNTLSVELHDAVGEYGQYTYGPFTNEESVSNWGTQSATVVVNDGTPEDQADYYLSTYAAPANFVSSITFRSEGDLGPAVGLELYQAARVKFGTADLSIDETYRVLAIEHDILPDSWVTRVYFRPMEASEAITVTPPIGGADVPVQDLTPYSRSYQSGAATTTHSASSLSVPLAVVFDKPYATAPRVVATTGHASYFASVSALTATGFTLSTRLYSGTSSASVACQWVAIPS